MKIKIYNSVFVFILTTLVAHSQTFNKKVNENFKVNSEVELVINTTNVDIEIETWNKNEVSIEGVMEVEGVSKEEADKILKNWKFEALGNSSKVKIAALSNNAGFEFSNDFNYNFDFKFDFPEMDVEIPHFEFPEMPEMPEMPEFEFDYQAYKMDTTYLKKYKAKFSKVVEEFEKSHFKKKLDSLNNSLDYIQRMEAFKISTEKMVKDLKKSKWFMEIQHMQDSDAFKQKMEGIKSATEKATKEVLANKDKILAQVEMAKIENRAALAEIKRMKAEGELDSLNFRENIYLNYGTNKNSKVKIKKYLKIKVPKKATFDLNVRHGKVSIPESNKKMSAIMSYGDFVGGTITGEKNELNFSNSPVVISSLTSSNVTLKNVPNARFGIVENVNLFSNSSDVVIDKVGVDVSLSHKFGKLNVNKITPDFNRLNIVLDYANARVNLSKTSCNFQINGKKTTFKLNGTLKESKETEINGMKSFKGFLINENSRNKLFLTGVFSTVNLL